MFAFPNPPHLRAEYHPPPGRMRARSPAGGVIPGLSAGDTVNPAVVWQMGGGWGQPSPFKEMRQLYRDPYRQKSEMYRLHTVRSVADNHALVNNRIENSSGRTRGQSPSDYR